MTRFFLRRLLSLIPTLFLVIVVAFVLTRMAPGGPFARERDVPPAVLENLNKKFNLDKSVPEQFVLYLGMILQGDLGPSMRNRNMTVNEMIEQGLPVSMGLGTLALTMALIAGVAVGIVSALRQNRWPDYLAMSFAVIGISIPLFVVGPFLQLVFAVHLKILPLGQWISEHGLSAIVLPAIALSLPPFAYIARITRASLLEVLRSDYIRTARAKGLPEHTVIIKHSLKGAMLPVLSYLGPAFAGIVIGSVVIEQIFAIPGVGKPFVQSAINRDYTLIMGEVIVYAVILIVINFVVDMVYGLLDPRISYK